MNAQPTTHMIKEIEMTKTYKQRAIETNNALQANIAQGGERERQTRHALNLADTYHSYCELKREQASKDALARYNGYCERIGFDPMVDFPL